MHFLLPPRSQIQRPRGPRGNQGRPVRREGGGDSGGEGGRQEPRETRGTFREVRTDAMVFFFSEPACVLAPLPGVQPGFDRTARTMVLPTCSVFGSFRTVGPPPVIVSPRRKRN